MKKHYIIPVIVLLILALLVVGYCLTLNLKKAELPPLAIYPGQEDFRLVNNPGTYSMSLPIGWQISPFIQKELLTFFDPAAQEQETDAELTQGMKLIVSYDQFTSSEEANKKIEDDLKAADSVQEVRLNQILAKQVIEHTLGYALITYIQNGNTVITVVGAIGGQSSIDEYKNTYDSILHSITLL